MRQFIIRLPLLAAGELKLKAGAGFCSGEGATESVGVAIA